MVALLLITHEALGAEMLRTATHILGKAPTNVAALAVEPQDQMVLLQEKAKGLIANLEIADGLMILVDIYGATPGNLACYLLSQYPTAEACAGLNIPMLLRAFSYRAGSSFPALTDKIIQGGQTGIIRISEDVCYARH